MLRAIWQRRGNRIVGRVNLFIMPVLFVLITMGSVLPNPAHAQFDIIYAVEQCPSKSALQQLIQLIRNSPQETEIACDLAAWLNGGSRWFERDGVHADPIDAVTCVNATVYMTYRRDGKRWGWAKMTAHVINGWAVLAGDWYQQSKMRGKSFNTPSFSYNGVPVPSIPIPFGTAYADDHGGIVYVFGRTPSGWETAGGTGVDYGDKSPNRNWLTGR